jgi:Zn-dependent alcohol dehydrogenase
MNKDESPMDHVHYHKKRNWPHVAIVGCMALSLGTAIVAAAKKSTTTHVVSGLCFVGMAMVHLFMHQRQLSHRVKAGLRSDTKRIRSETKS